MEKIEDFKKRIIVALDVEGKKEALSLVSALEQTEIFKIGLELFTAEGPSLLKEIKSRRKKIFLDLKLHDIPNTVAKAVRVGVRHGVQMMTLHSSGGLEMMARAADSAAQEAEKEKTIKPLLLAVTVLTSLKDAQLQEIGISGNVPEQVLRLAKLAKRAGMDGVVCSPQEIEVIRKEMGAGFLVVTPGIRPSWAASDDQKRIMTPAQAIEKGADYLVIGRPIIEAPSPQRAFQKIIEELNSSQYGSSGKNCS
jgi:orotidine-5'-phosphate decarboxylase